MQDDCVYDKEGSCFTQAYLKLSHLQHLDSFLIYYQFVGRHMYISNKAKVRKPRATKY